MVPFRADMELAVAGHTEAQFDDKPGVHTMAAAAADTVVHAWAAAESTQAPDVDRNVDVHMLDVAPAMTAAVGHMHVTPHNVASPAATYHMAYIQAAVYHTAVLAG